MEFVKSITLDVYNDRGKRVTMFAKQGDTARVLKITLTASGVKIVPDEGAGASFRVRKCDGHSVDYPVKIEQDGTISVPLSAQAVACPGRCIADVFLEKNGEVLSNANFDLFVEAAPTGDGLPSEDDYGVLLDARNRAEAAARAAAESAETAGEHEQTAGEHEAAAGESAGAAARDRQAAETAADEAGEHETAAKKAETAAGDYATMAKSYAVGDTGSRDGEDEDNSKYYHDRAAAEAQRAEVAADRAESIAQGALGYYETPDMLREQHPSAEAGNWAIVGSTDTIWVWDSDTETWTDSGNKTDLSQYYTKAEVDARLENINVNVDETPTEGSQNPVSSGGVYDAVQGATSRSWEVTVSAEGWTEGADSFAGVIAKWQQTVEAQGITEDAVLSIDRSSGFVSGDYAAACAVQWYIRPGVDSVTVWAPEKTTGDFTVRITEVR